MRVVPLAAVPNQSFTVTLNETRWSLRLTAGRGVAICDVSKSGELLLSGSRVLAGEPLIPYAYLQAGNFLFVVNGGDLPDYQKFNVSQFLVYLSDDEINSIKLATFGEVAAARSIEYLTTDDGFYLTTDDGSILTDD